MKKISDVMTRDAKLVNPNDTIQDAAKLMKACDCGVLPVSDGDRLVGMITDRDIVAGGEYQDWEGAKAFWAVQSYDPETGRWETMPRMQLAHHGFAAGLVGNILHVAGGGFQ
ncbi:CBS domain-containing protein [Bradyrhizobium sp. STM 3557]|uniref:CBS domain-containing protein n=1 Tax=Bradyrhizobium sp. STM 3557 TaxID=578920 RepID=UPI003890E5DA